VKKRIRTIAAVAIAVSFLASTPCSALVALPMDAGIDYRTMRVADPSKLKARGMKRAEVGDVVMVGPVEGGGLAIINKRTGEKIRWGIAK
jgi:hypothetical protein